MKKIFIMLCIFFAFRANAATTSELLVQSINDNLSNYLCNHSELQGKEYKEIVVCVEGIGLRSIELIDLWVSNFNMAQATQEESKKLIEKAKSLIPDSTYVLSIKAVGDDKAKGEFVYMTAFCSECSGFNSETVLDDNSSFVFESLKALSNKD
ncbi:MULTISPECIES: hypothetical protein [unclassified Vibrio]|uniref:hypothetical protein n=1 Tax=unclassified Vibrio TaxID=2614977 RepID=UPI0029642810|nr:MULTISPECIES: hypothetical protein [unclassified Vibrio]MDW1632807.1 hypothetical protein [Vibrio sp. Vb2907]MDW1703582.1 hypothetical protein [Vibrio sp. Vb2917]MDW1718130.1 hypothetical protein [Vibrio sp. Vb2979]